VDNDVSLVILLLISEDNPVDNDVSPLILELISEAKPLDNEVLPVILEFVSDVNDVSMLTNLLKTVPANCASPLSADANSPRVSNISGAVPNKVESLLFI
jgi:hypothetical protein